MDKQRRPIKYMTGQEFNLRKDFFMVGHKAQMEVSKELNVSEQKVADYIINNIIPSKNVVLASYNDIQKTEHVSRETISSALKRLQALSLIKHFNNVIYISPDWVVDGGAQKYNTLKSIYYSF